MDWHIYTYTLSHASCLCPSPPGFREAQEDDSDDDDDDDEHHDDDAYAGEETRSAEWLPLDEDLMVDLSIPAYFTSSDDDDRGDGGERGGYHDDDAAVGAAVGGGTLGMLTAGLEGLTMTQQER